MDEDTEMVDDSHASYPDPTASVSGTETPYPFLGQSEDEGASQQLQPGDTNYAVQAASSTRPGTGPGFTTLADYFNLGNKALFNVNRLVSNTDEARRWSVNGEKTTTPRRNGILPGQHGTNESDVRASSSSTTFALPGFHYLPPLDGLDHAARQNPPPLAPKPPTARQPSPPPQQGRGGRPRGRGPGRPRAGWRQALKGTEHADLFKTPRLPREATARKRGRGRGRGGHADPGHEYKSIQSQATVAFLDGDLQKAKEHTLAALKVNPEVWASYSLLHEITQKQGLELESIQVLAAGAPVKRDPDIWVEIATRLMAFRANDKTPIEVEFALKCYEEAVKLQNNHFGARKARMELYCEQKSWNRARKECGSLLSMQPGNLELLHKYSELCDLGGVLDDLRGAIDAYNKAFQLYGAQPSFGDPDEQWDHLNLYLDMLLRTGPPHSGVYQLKRIARWFLGRQEDRFWNDIQQDDREFDETAERRIYIPEVRAGQVVQDSSRYGLGLPIDLRVKLGVFRLQMGPGCHTEAFRHFEHLRRLTDPTEIEPMLDLFLDVANALRTRTMFGAAIEYYDRLKPVSHLLNREYWMNFAQCCREVGRNAEAEKGLRKVIEENENEVQARINLIKLYESTAQSVKALPVADELIRIGRSETLSNENLGVYIKASKRVKKKAARQVGADDDEGQARQSSDDDDSTTDGSDDDMDAPQSIVQRVRLDEAKLATTGGVKRAAPTKRPALRALAPRRTALQDDKSADEAEDIEDEDAALALQSGPVQDPVFVRGGRYLNSLAEQKTRVTKNYTKLTELWPVVESGKDPTALQQWTQYAAAMAKDFRLMKEFYPVRSRDQPYTGLRTGLNTASRNMANEAEALKRRLLQDAASVGGNNVMSATAYSTFHGITFDEWHRIFSELALSYAKGAQQNDCYNVLKKVLLPANVFQDDPELWNATLAVCLCCALIFNDARFVFDITRCLEESTDSAAVKQLIAACGRMGPSTSGLHTRKHKTWLSSSLDEHDYLAMPAEAREDYDWGKETERLKAKAEQTGGTKHDLDPGLFVRYADALNNAGPANARTILPYLFRALALNPDNAVINLIIATAYILQATRKPRAVEQYDIAQGLSFFYRYHDLRIASGKASHRQEAEFNLARMWHLLGTTHLALAGYEKVLELSAEVQKENKHQAEVGVEDYANDAAFALQAIYKAAGNEAAAQGITEEWMVL